ncbi:MAG: phosphoribosylamine--glycine ligase [Alphaproteobacteria bacterium]|nr:phosphoribosylamine--glycine ligase [Alphaproteobacteria bacterium]
MNDEKKPVTVLVIGSGAREHAICARLADEEASSDFTSEMLFAPKVFSCTTYCYPGNGGTPPLPVHPLVPASLLASKKTDPATIMQIVRAHSIDLVVIGPEQPLVEGVSDALRREGVEVFGPSQAAAQLEGSKGFARAVMDAANIPQPRWEEVTTAVQGQAVVDAWQQEGIKAVVKADGLAAGKGVVVCDTPQHAYDALADCLDNNAFGAAGQKVVVEERLFGKEISYFAICAGEDFIPLGCARDHKRALDGDRGPNTGGMGAFSPVPGVGPDVESAIGERVVKPLLATMRARGTPFHGVLFVGLMVEEDDPIASMRVLEFNVRFGDPECQTILARLRRNMPSASYHDFLLKAMQWSARHAHHDLVKASTGGQGGMRKPQLWNSLSNDPANADSLGNDTVVVTIVVAAKSYPQAGLDGVPLPALDSRSAHCVIHHAGTVVRDGVLLAHGGRIFSLTAEGKSLDEARDRAYHELATMNLQPESFRWRKDIGA